MSIFEYFQQFKLSTDQKAALEKLEVFLDSPMQVFILKGYAGSGKTSILKGLVEYLNASEKEFALMAPTGRAAKVIREMTGQEAFTIHKSIYSYDEMVEVDDGNSFYYYYKIRNNIGITDTIFIVDEASMLSDSKCEGEFFRFGTGHLLTDLMEFTRMGQGEVKSKIIFIGDPCQLPPVGDNSSKALFAEYLRNKFRISAEEAELKEVLRQGAESGILRAASRIRQSISAGYFNDFNLRSNGRDILNPAWDGFLDTWQNESSTKIIIAYKNKTCHELNRHIRERIFGNAELPVQKSDIVIIGGNCYIKNIFNGEFAVVNDVSQSNTVRTVALRGKQAVRLSWRDIELVFPEAESENKTVKGRMLENFLYGDNTLRPEEWQALYVDFTMRHKGLKQKTEEFKEAIRADDYFNCILIKFGYAVTCHKAQGGEWENVFTVWDNDNRKDYNCYKDKQLRQSRDNEPFYRWAYTAVTRASKKLFALNPPFFNSYSSLSFLNESVIGSLQALTGTNIQEEILDIDPEMLKDLRKFGLLDQPVQIQDHFIRIRHAVRAHYIEMNGWERKSMEIFYYFKREDNLAAFKTWVNKDNRFNGKFQVIPSSTGNIEFAGIVEPVLKFLPPVSIKRNTIDTVIGGIEFELDQEERFPFTRCLFDDINLLLNGTGISLDVPEHLPYRERYNFRRAGETAVIDFEYKGNGFFGRVVPVKNQTNSQLLVAEIEEMLKSLKEEEYAG